MQLDNLASYGVLLFVIVFIAGLWIWDKVRFDRRERDFLNRFMARNFLEYTSGSSRMAPKPTVQQGIDRILEEIQEDQEAAVRIR